MTGAGGYIGRSLCAELARQLREGAIDSLTVCDLSLAHVHDTPGMRRIEGDLGEPGVLAAVTDAAPDTVFHLAGITSRLAEEQFALGLRVNVAQSMTLFERLSAGGDCPVLVYTSSIAVYGPPMPAAVDDRTPPAPALSYGAQKLMMETLLADYGRRGSIDARSVRLPGVVARPAQAQVALSSFASDLIRELAEGRRYTCPVGPDAQIWWLSLPLCVEHLLHAARVEPKALPPGRAWNLPALRASPAEVVQAMCRRFGPELADRVSYDPQPALQAQFAQWPPLRTEVAQALGMHHDGDLDTLLARALAPSPPPLTSTLRGHSQ